MSIACGACGAENQDDAKFCSQCGRALPLTCRNCGRRLAADAKFCDNCGMPVPENAPGAGEPGGAVRKTVTVLFCDLGGSTRFGEHVDPEAARDAMTHYYELIADTVVEHGGKVAKYTGDGLMALFGVPEIAEDDAVRAVATGAAMQERFGTFADDVFQRFGQRLTFRVGVNTGEVVIAEGDADVVGDALNVAARLESAADPGRVLVGEETWRLARSAYDFDALGEVSVAGRAEPVSVYRLVTGDERVETATPFVGREEEMARLGAVLDAATDERSARVVTVVASPGVGKTRLAREFLDSVAGDVTGFEVRCERTPESTFAPIADLLRLATGIAHESDAVVRSRLADLLPVEADDRGRMVDGLAGVLGIGAPRTTEETFWAVRRLIESMAADRPILLIVDDLQWAEPLFLDLLEHLREWVRDAAVLLVGLARPEIREVRPALVETGRLIADVVMLDGLDAAATEELAARLLGAEHLPADLVDRLPGSTAGNPLFVRELVRMLVDDEVLVQGGSGWDLAVDVDAVEVPPTIQSLLSARVERLGRSDRTLLELASVVGTEFSLGALRMLTGDAGNTDLEGGLERLRRNELIDPTGTYLGDEPLFRFHHALIQDAAYRRILKGRRADLHEQTGRWVDERGTAGAGEPEAAVAYHFEQAYRYRHELGAVGDDTVALGRRAATLLQLAAEAALDRDDLGSAGGLVARALACLDRSATDERAPLLLLGAEALLGVGDVTGAPPYLDELTTIAVDDDRLTAWTTCFRAQLTGLTDPDRLVEAEASARGAADALAGLNDPAGQAKAHLVRAGLLARLGRIGDCEGELDLGLSAARVANDRRRVVAVLGAAPVAALWGPSPVARAGGRCLDVLRLLRITSASPSVEATSMRCQAVLEALRGRLDQARSLLTGARATLEEAGLARDLLENDLFAGLVELVAGDPVAAEGPLRSAYGGLDALGVGVDAGQAAALLARSLLAQGRLDEADELAAASEMLAGQNLKTAIAWRSIRAQIRSATGDHEAAVGLAEEAVEIAATTDILIDHGDAVAALATVCAAAGDGARAARARAEARRLYEAKEAALLVDRLGVDDLGSEGATGRSEVEASPVAAGNLATRARRELLRANERGDFEAVRAVTAEDYQFVDRRPGMETEILGREGYLDNLRVIYEGLESGTMQIVEVLAERGDLLSLVRARVNSDGFYVEFLSVTEVDEDGIVRYTSSFEPEDEDAARRELDERAASLAAPRAPGSSVATGPTLDLPAGTSADALDEAMRQWLDGQGLAGVAEFELFRRVTTAYNRRDWDAMRGVFADDIVWVSHRPMTLDAIDSLPTAFLPDARGPDAVVGHFVDTAELLPDAVSWISEIHRHRSGGMVATISSRASTAEGEELRFGWLLVAQNDGTAVHRLEVYSEDDLAAGLARFDDLVAHERLANDVTRAADQLTEAFARGDVEATRSYFTDDFERVSRVPGPRSPDGDRDALVESMFAGRSVGLGDLHFETVSVLGDRLALREAHWTTADGYDRPFLSVFEGDGAGRIRALTNIDPDDLAGAFDVAMEAYVEQVPTDVREGAVLAREFFAAVNRRDWVAVEACFHERTGWASHRSLSLDSMGTMPSSWLPVAEGSGEVVARMGEVVDAMPDVVILVAEVHRFGPNGSLVTIWERGTADDGSTVEFDMLAVTTSVDGLIGAIEMFDVDDFETALDHFEELTGGSPDEPSATAVSRLGDRIQLDEYRSTDGPRLRLREIDGEGRIGRSTEFDPDELVGAFDAAMEAYVELVPAEEREAVALAREFFAAVNRRDWAAVEACYHEAGGWESHRSLSLDSMGTMPSSWLPAAEGSEQVVARIREIVDAVPDLVTLIEEVHHLDPYGILMSVSSQGTAQDGSRFELDMLVVATRVDDHIGVTEIFDRGDLETAWARFDELTGPEGGMLENEATRARDAIVAALHAGDRERALAGYAPSFARESRRRGPKTGATTAEGVVDSMLALLEVFDRLEVVTLAALGDRIQLSEFRSRSADAYELWGLTLGEIDAEGRARREIHFDSADLAEAADVALRWYAEGEGAAYADDIAVVRSLLRGFNDGDWGSVRAALDDDARWVSHRSVGLSSLAERPTALLPDASGADEVIERFRDVFGLADSASYIERVRRAAPGLFLADLAYRIGVGDADPLLVRNTTICQLRDGRVYRLEGWDPDEVDAATAYFEELTED